MPLEISPRAESDLEDIAEYVARHAPGRFIALLDNIDAELQRIEHGPLLYQLRPDIGNDARLAVVGRYVILFRISAHTVRVERIVHGSRQLPSLLQ